MFLTEYADLGGLFIADRRPHRFEVRSRSGASGAFGYRVVARRLDNVGKRMEKVVIPPTPDLDLTRVFRTDATPVPPVPPKR